jgi:hypothetical protein
MILSKEKSIYCLIIAASFVTARAIVFGQFNSPILVHTGSTNKFPDGWPKENG